MPKGHTSPNYSIVHYIVYLLIQKVNKTLALILKYIVYKRFFQNKTAAVTSAAVRYFINLQNCEFPVDDIAQIRQTLLGILEFSTVKHEDSAEQQ